VAEQLALEHAVGEPAHVDHDERLAGARARRVEPAGDELLAGAVLAGDEHVRRRRADALHEAEHGLHGRALGEDLDAPGGGVAAQRAHLALQAVRAAQRGAELRLRAQRGDEARVVPRLLDVVARPAPHRLHGALDAPPRRHHDHGERGVERLQLEHEVEPLAPDVVSRA
jgi:hypothetical protein